jgi:hypothetical protein
LAEPGHFEQLCPVILFATTTPSAGKGEYLLENASLALIDDSLQQFPG